LGDISPMSIEGNTLCHGSLWKIIRG